VHPKSIYGSALTTSWFLATSTVEEFRRWLQLGRQRNLDAWEMYPSTANAYFNPPSNEVRSLCANLELGADCNTRLFSLPASFSLPSSLKNGNFFLSNSTNEF